MSDGLDERPASTSPAAMVPPDFASLLAYAPRPGLLKARVIAITGGAGGIGRAVALGAARLGATVVVLDRSRAGLKTLEQTLAGEGVPAPDLVPMDFTSASIADYQQFAKRIEGQYGRLDGLVNNVGLIGALTPFEHAEPAVWQQVIATNLVAPFFLTQWCMPLLRRAPDPALVFSLHRAQRAFWGAYGVAKAGQEALLHILADEYHLAGEAPVRVFGIDTGPVATAARRQHYPAEPPDTHPKPAAVTGPYLYALGPDARGFTDVVLRRE